MRRRLAWGVTLPLVFAGSQAAHALAYRLVYPQATVRVRALLATGHSYAGWLPIVLASAGAVVLVSLTVAAADAARGRPARALPAWAFAALAPASFTLQELLELSLHTGTVGWHAVLAPTFLPGLMLQLPFALAAYLAARLLLRTAERVGRALARPLRAVSPVAVAFTPPAAAPLRRAPVSSRSSRAPPRGLAFS